jgi:hypothetical protein
VGIAAVLVAGAIGLGVGVRAWIDTRDATERTTASLRDTRAELAQARDDLAGASADLGVARDALEDDLITLDLRESERDAAQANFETIERMLDDAEAQLAASSADLDDRTRRLDALNRCLVGVSQALNQAAVADTDGMAVTIDRIEATCAEAGALL